MSLYLFSSLSLAEYSEVERVYQLKWSERLSIESQLETSNPIIITYEHNFLESIW
jgi:hypothetical protein